MAGGVYNTVHLLSEAVRYELSTFQVNDVRILESAGQRGRFSDQVDSSIELLTQHLVELKRYRNSVASISLLPDELFSEILLHYLWLMDPWGNDWVKIILVCKRWRDVIVNDTRFCGYVRFDHRTKQVIARLRRSKNYPIHGSAELFENNTADYIFHSFNLFPRTQSLKLTYGSTETLDQFFADIEEMPILQSLTIECSGNNPWTLPSFLVQRTPLLHQLHLRGVKFSSAGDRNALSNLTSLQLEGDRTSSVPSDPSIQDLLNMLRNMPHLEDLNIVHYVKHRDEDLDLLPIACLLSLPHLLTLKFYGAAMAAIVLLYAVQLPSFCRMDILPSSITDTSELHDDLLSRLLIPIHRYMHRADSPKIRSISLQGSLETYSQVCFYTAPEAPVSALDFGRTAHLQILTYPETQPADRRIMRKILDAVPVTHVEHINALMVYNDGSRSPAGWRALFQKIPRPVAINVGANYAALDLLSGMIAAIKDKQTKFQPTRRRVAGCCRFSRFLLEGRYTGGAFGIPEDNTLFYDALVGSLHQYRETAGEPLNCLKVNGLRRGDSPSDIHLDRLQPLVLRLVDENDWVCDPRSIAWMDLMSAEILADAGMHDQLTQEQLQLLGNADDIRRQYEELEREIKPEKQNGWMPRLPDAEPPPSNCHAFPEPLAPFSEEDAMDIF